MEAKKFELSIGKGPWSFNWRKGGEAFLMLHFWALYVLIGWFLQWKVLVRHSSTKDFFKSFWEVHCFERLQQIQSVSGGGWLKWSYYDPRGSRRVGMEPLHCQTEQGEGIPRFHLVSPLCWGRKMGLRWVWTNPSCQG